MENVLLKFIFLKITAKDEHLALTMTLATTAIKIKEVKLKNNIKDESTVLVKKFNLEDLKKHLLN